MLKKFLIISLACFVAFANLFALTISADDITKQKVEQIIAGNQDYLVLANIIEKGTSAYEVEVFEEIGVANNEEGSKKEDGGIVNLRINVSGFKTYMYYENIDYRPQKGDNVLLSLEFNGNSYSIKNGAYLVDSTSHEQFRFKVPDIYNGTGEALELNALYIYVHSNGEINNLTIKNDGIYGKDANGKEKKIAMSSGITFIDEYGDTTENPTAPVERYDENTGVKTESKWRIVLAIIIIGSVAGFGVIKLNKKFQKRYD